LAERWSGVRRAFWVFAGARQRPGPPVGHLDLDDRGEGLEARARPGGFGYSVAWLCFILAFWGFIGAFTLPSVFYGQELSRDYLLWALIWIAMGALICYVSGDYVVRETLVVAGGKLTLKRNYLVFALSASFRAEKVRDLRAVGPGNGRVEIEVGGGTHRLRTRLAERDARKLVEELRRHLSG
jgi:hypothetical protein